MELIEARSEATRKAAEEQIHAVLREVVRIKGDLRSRVTPRNRHDERFDDLQK